MKRLLIIAGLTLLLLPSFSQAQGFDLIGRLPNNCTDVVETAICRYEDKVTRTQYEEEFPTMDACLKACTGKDAPEGSQCTYEYRGGHCDFNEILGSLDLLVQWGTGIAGAVALLMFVIGGVYFLGSRGNPEWVQRGKNILKGTTISLFYILGSWLLVSAILDTLGVNDPNYELYSECAGNDNARCGPEKLGVCHNGLCYDRCDWKNQQEPPEFEGYRWSCQPLEYCNGGSGATCEDLPFCTVGLCPGATYCCYNPLEEFIGTIPF